MKKLGQFNQHEIAQYQKASLRPLDLDRQAGYAKVWDAIKQRIKLPNNHNFTIDKDWNILDRGQRKDKK